MSAQGTKDEHTTVLVLKQMGDALASPRRPSVIELAGHRLLLKAGLDAAKREHELRAAMVALLAEIQWCSLSDHPDGGYYDACPVCEGGRPSDRKIPAELRGHSKDCTLAALLAKAVS